ncbi:MAG TPA: Crp/Fnr family transcriptional regulator [Sulfuriferula sp.]|nr:Crp/Fnr family transcriptional regulator [Sulfuriferula sp.]
MPTTPDIKDFRLAYLFRDLDRALLAQIAERACWRELDAGEPLFAKNDPGKRFFLVKKGTMKLFLLAEDGQEHVMELIGREHLFAEAVMFMGGHYPVHAAALEPTRLIAFDAEFFLGLLRGNADLCLSLLAAMSRRVHGLVTEIDRLTLQTGVQRFAQYLLAQPAQKTAGTRTVRLPATKQTIASLLGIQPETLSRILSKLRDDGLIQISAETVVVLKPDALARIF